LTIYFLGIVIQTLSCLLQPRLIDIFLSGELRSTVPPKEDTFLSKV
jgi:hypothetical protein